MNHSPAVLVIGKSVEGTKKGRDRDAVVMAAGEEFLLSSDIGTAWSFSIFVPGKRRISFKFRLMMLTCNTNTPKP